MALWIRKERLEKEIENLERCSELEFRRVYSRLEDNINSYPIESIRRNLLSKLNEAKERYERDKEVKYIFSSWRRL